MNQTTEKTGTSRRSRGSFSALLGTAAVLAVFGLGLPEGRAGDASYDFSSMPLEQLGEVGMSESPKPGGGFTWRGTGDGDVDPERCEYGLKAAYLYNFAKFVEWPESAFSSTDGNLIVGILGEDPFGDALETIAGKTVNGKKLVIKRFDPGQDLSIAHILFVSDSAAKRFGQVLPALREGHILTVGDIEDFATQGGIVNFRVDDDKVGFEVNIGAAKEAGIKLSSKLLRLAKIV